MICIPTSDFCRPSVWSHELDHSLGRGSLLLRRTQRIHSGLLQVTTVTGSYALFCVASVSMCHHHTHHHPACVCLSKGSSSWAPERATCPTTCAWSMSTATLPFLRCSSTSVPCCLQSCTTHCICVWKPHPITLCHSHESLRLFFRVSWPSYTCA